MSVTHTHTHTTHTHTHTHTTHTTYTTETHTTPTHPHPHPPTTPTPTHTCTTPHIHITLDLLKAESSPERYWWGPTSQEVGRGEKRDYTQHCTVATRISLHSDAQQRRPFLPFLRKSATTTTTTPIYAKIV